MFLDVYYICEGPFVRVSPPFFDTGILYSKEKVGKSSAIFELYNEQETPKIGIRERAW